MPGPQRTIAIYAIERRIRLGQETWPHRRGNALPKYATVSHTFTITYGLGC